MKKDNVSCLEPEVPDQPNSGLAIVMKTILNTNKPKRKKSVVLAKAKKLSTKHAIEALQNSLTDNQSENNVQLKTSDWVLKGKTKPDPLERNKEKRLAKITISGVVNLFNTVNQYKNNTEKSDSILKNGHLKLIDKSKFLGILQNGSVPSNTKNNDNQGTIGKKDKEPNSSDTWDVLKKDFVNNTKWKNWDKALVDNN